MILALSPHCDDHDLGCSGYLSTKKDVKVIGFSDCSNPDVAREFYEVNDGDSKVLNFKRRTFNENRQRILDHLLQYKPEIVLVPSTTDCHQDHQVITQEAIRAYKNSTILGYYLPWNNVVGYSPNAFFPMTGLQVRLKISRVQNYKSQEHRPYMTEDAIRSTLVHNGLMAGYQYAEAFEVIRMRL